MNQADRCGAPLLIVALAVSMPHLARAQEPAAGLESARAAFDQGTAAYERELFTEAEDWFGRAYDEMPVDHPRRGLILMNIALAIERQGGRERDALAAWRLFRNAPGEAEVEDIQRADSRIRELAARLERRSMAAADVDRGPHIAGPILLAAGGAAVIAGVIVGGISLATDGDLRAACPDAHCADTAANRDLHAEVMLLSNVADALWIGGAVVAATGLVLTFVLTEDSDVSGSAVCAPAGCAVTLRSSF